MDRLAELDAEIAGAGVSSPELTTRREVLTREIARFEREIELGTRTDAVLARASDELRIMVTHSGHTMTSKPFRRGDLDRLVAALVSGPPGRLDFFLKRTLFPLVRSCRVWWLFTGTAQDQAALRDQVEAALTVLEGE